MKRDVFQGIADPTRREILFQLSNGPKTVNEISSEFEMSRTAVSKHLTMLKECQLIRVEEKGRERHIHAKLEKLSEVAIWVNQYRLFWHDSLDILEKLLKKENNHQKQ